MSKSFKIDLTGQRFGRWTVLEFVPTEDRHTHWLCKCDCGNEKVVRSYALKDGSSKSCGCRNSDAARVCHTVHGASNRGAKTRLYNIWCGMKTRCYNINNHKYKDYGGRGIKICTEWKNDFSAFRDWALSNGYADNLSIDRIDNDGNYEPNNCRWADNKTQCANRRSNIWVEYNGQRMLLSHAADIAGIGRLTLKSRYDRGDKGERLFRPLDK